MTGACTAAGRADITITTPGEIAAALGALAGWIEGELAGGTPAKWVAQQAAAGAWHLATGAWHLADAATADVPVPAVGRHRENVEAGTR